MRGEGGGEMYLTMKKSPPPMPQPMSNTRSPGRKLRDFTNSRVVSGPPELTYPSPKIFSYLGDSRER